MFRLLRYVAVLGLAALLGLAMPSAASAHQTSARQAACGDTIASWIGPNGTTATYTGTLTDQSGQAAGTAKVAINLLTVTFSLNDRTGLPTPYVFNPLTQEITWVSTDEYVARLDYPQCSDDDEVEETDLKINSLIPQDVLTGVLTRTG